MDNGNVALYVTVFGNFVVILLNFIEFIFGIMNIKILVDQKFTESDEFKLAVGTLALSGILLLVYGILAYMSCAKVTASSLKYSLGFAAVVYFLFLIVGAIFLTNKDYAKNLFDLKKQVDDAKYCDDPQTTSQTDQCDLINTSYRFALMTAISIGLQFPFLILIGIFSLQNNQQNGADAGGNGGSHDHNKSTQMTNRPLNQEQYHHQNQNQSHNQNAGKGQQYPPHDPNSFTPSYPTSNPVYQNKNPTMTPTPAYNNNNNNMNNNGGGNNANNSNHTNYPNRPPPLNNTNNNNYFGGSAGGGNNTNAYVPPSNQNNNANQNKNANANANANPNQPKRNYY